MNWLRALPGLLEHEDVVLVTVAQTRGSVPREAGTCMLVSLICTVDTIGGGHLEWEAMAQARAMLLQAASVPAMQRLSLGASLGQCCGGVVWFVFERIGRNEHDVWRERLRAVESGQPLMRELSSDNLSQWTKCKLDEAQPNPRACLETYPLPSPGSSSHPLPSLGEGTAKAGPEPSLSLSQAWERVPREGRERGSAVGNPTVATETKNTWRFTQTITPPSFNIILFGAGHVGAAIIHILSTLDAHIRWVDVRDDLFGSTPAKVTCIATDTPEEEIDKAPPDTFFLVLTHSHALDLELTARILKRDAFAWFGLIGSRTKRARFEHRLHAQGISAAQVARMTCPIGVAGISDKAPQAIAIAVVAQLLQARERHAADKRERELTHDD